MERKLEPLPNARAISLIDQLFELCGFCTAYGALDL